MSDYDGTLAEGGRVSSSTRQALVALRESGRRLLLVTGRELPDLLRVFPEPALFDRIVAENGGVLYTPASREERLLGETPSEALVARLRDRGVPLSIGRVILATHEPHETTVLDAIRDLGLEHQVIFNKGAVMVLPSGVNKATGLRAALGDLGISTHNAVAIGDAENDHTLLAECEAGVAVANALPLLKERADWVTHGDAGDGVTELAHCLLASDLRELTPRLSRHDIVLGKKDDGTDVRVHAYGPRLLVCGASGSGKSTLANSLLERLTEAGYRYCLIDPEGDFTNLRSALIVGDERQEPSTDEVIGVLRGDNSVVVNLLGVELDQRPQFLGPLMARIEEYRIRHGMPHWVVVDEAHHMMPEGELIRAESVTNLPPGTLLVTVHPERLAEDVLRQIEEVFVVGKSPKQALSGFLEQIGAPGMTFDWELSPGEALRWRKQSPGSLERFDVLPPRAERRRHERKYAAGDLGDDKSFYFRGPKGELNLRAGNLALFLQMAAGVDDATWTHHLRRHDYSGWLRDSIKNEELARAVLAIEADRKLSAAASRARIRAAIEQVYTLPA